MGVKKLLVVFDFRAMDFDDDDDDDGEESAAGATFLIARYIFLRVGDPEDFNILKPSSPYVRTRKRYYDGDKFSNPVRVVRPDDGGGGRRRSFGPWRRIPSRRNWQNLRRSK